MDFDGAVLGAPQTAEAVYVPVNQSPPVISGSATVGSALVCNPGDWGDSPTAFAYSWSRDGTSISGANAGMYTITTADEGHTLECLVSASNAAGEATAASNSMRVPAPAPHGAPPASTTSSGTAPTEPSAQVHVKATKSTGAPTHLTSKQRLARALARCRKLENRKRRAACVSTARRRYHHEVQIARQRTRARAIAACKHVKNPRKRKACVSTTERRYG
jgi:hypothetical protein